MELYRKVIIKSENDYPKSDGEYFCNRNGFMSVQKLLANPAHKSYMREIRWYLQPIEQPEPDIPMGEMKGAEDILKEKFKYLDICSKITDLRYTTLYGRADVRVGTRIMYDAMYSMILRVMEDYHAQFTTQRQEITDDIMFAFIDWLHSAHYSKYWGSDEPNNGKWYKNYSHADRKYYTLRELFELAIGDGKIRDQGKGIDLREEFDKMNCLIGYLEGWLNNPRSEPPFELKDVINEATEYLSKIKPQ